MRIHFLQVQLTKKTRNSKIQTTIQAFIGDKHWIQNLSTFDEGILVRWEWEEFPRNLLKPIGQLLGQDFIDTPNWLGKNP